MLVDAEAIVDQVGLEFLMDVGIDVRPFLAFRYLIRENSIIFLVLRFARFLCDVLPLSVDQMYVHFQLKVVRIIGKSVILPISHDYLHISLNPPPHRKQRFKVSFFRQCHPV